MYGTYFFYLKKSRYSEQKPKSGEPERVFNFIRKYISMNKTNLDYKKKDMFFVLLCVIFFLQLVTHPCI